MRTHNVLFLLLCLTPAVLGAQSKPRLTAATESVNRFGIFGGMGVHGTYAPSIVDHLNNADRSGKRSGDFATTVEFFAGCEMPVSASWAVKAEHSLLFKSYTLEATIFGKEEFRYDMHAPTLMAQYVIPGRGYFLKFGAGGGYHWGTIVARTSMYGQEMTYSAHGLGMRAEAEGQTGFDEHLFGYISVSAGFEALGKVKADDGTQLTNGSGAVSLNYLTAGLRFGLMYFF